nr:hypothetical protein CFP56_13466 [Quercus suber]
MATKSPISVCLVCRPRGSSTGHAFPLSQSKRRRVTTMSVASSCDTFAMVSHVRMSQGLEARTSTGPRRMKQRDTAEALDSSQKLRASRIELFDKVSDFVPPKEAQQQVSGKATNYATLSGPLPHEKFRELLIMHCPATPGPADKPLRTLLRHQLLHCDHPRDIQKVFAVAMPRGRAASTLASLHEPLTRAIYRCRAAVDDFTVLKLIGGIIARLRHADLPVVDDFLILGLKFAARTRSKEHMKKYLRQLRAHSIPLKSSKFRAIIAKCSIGCRGLGEIRNGRWQRDDLLEVLHGFHDCHHLPPSAQFHLATFMDRADWYYLHGWVAILSRCRDIPALQTEWESWKISDARCDPTKLVSRIGRTIAKRRGDHFFIENFALAGAHKEAWAVMQEAELNFSDLHPRVQLMMLDGVEFAHVFDDSIRDGLLRKYDIQLQKIEAALGVRWISPGEVENGRGSHQSIEDIEIALERLAVPDWKLEEDFGYPYDAKSCNEKSTDNALRIAEEFDR